MFDSGFYSVKCVHVYACTSHFFKYLICFQFQDGASENKKHKKLGVTKKPGFHVHMPPELLIHIDVPVDVLKSFYLLPSMMYRIESLMLASQLRKEVGYNPTDCCIPSSLVICTLCSIISYKVLLVK